MRGLKREKAGNKAVWAVLLLAAGIMVTLAGCGAYAKGNTSSQEAVEAPQVMNSSAYDSATGAATGAIAVEGEMKAAQSDSSSADVGEVKDDRSDRKLIKTVSMDVETKEFDKVMSALESEVAALGGYIERMDTYNGSSYSNYRDKRYANTTIRVPKNQLNAFLETVSGMSNVVRRSDNVEDVTLVYVDLESHRDALRTEQSRLLELLERAETIEEIITIESRLSEVRYQLESMESQLRTYDNRVEYSTVYLNIDEVEAFTPVAEESVWERIADGFVGSLENIGRGFKEFFVGLIIHLPYLLLVTVFVLVLTFVIIKCNKKSSGKTKPAQEQRQVPPQQK